MVAGNRPPAPTPTLRRVSYALLVRNARIVDGTGAAAYTGELAVADGRIAAVAPGRLDGASAAREIDAGGHVLAPGFIDVHQHADLPLLTQPANTPYVMQGCTTGLLGADGLSYAPLTGPRLDEVRRYLAGLYGNPPELLSDWSSVAEYLARLERGIGSNVFYMVPHQALRLEVRGWQPGPATDEEVAAMQRLLRQGLAEGGLGLGTGLDYFPHNGATTDELAALCEVVREFDGVFVAHVRYRQVGVLDAVREVVRIAQRTGVKALISHLRSAASMPIVDEARARAIDVMVDTYPYVAGSSMFLMYLPDWFQAGGPDRILERLRDPALRQRVRAERTEQLTPSDVVICNVGANGPRALIGRTFGQVMAERGTDDVDTVCDLLLETNLAGGWIGFGGTEDDLHAVMTNPASMASSDGILSSDHPHPRVYGTYPRYLGRYCRELGWLTLEQTVAKMTGIPAARFGLRDRGVIREGAAADLVIFDPATVSDRATFENPRQYPIGISHVAVNGTLVVDNGQPTGALPGHVLRR